VAKRRHPAKHARAVTLALAIGSVAGSSGILAARGLTATDTASGTTAATVTTVTSGTASSASTSATTSDDNAAVPATSSANANVVTTTQGS
jgi:hypothetical protein